MTAQNELSGRIPAIRGDVESPAEKTAILTVGAAPLPTNRAVHLGSGVALSAWVGVLAVRFLIPQQGASFKTHTDYLTPVVLAVVGLILISWLAAYVVKAQREAVLSINRVLIVLGVVMIPWEAAVRLGLLEPPYFPSASRIIGVFFEDGGTLLLSIVYSLRLLLIGYTLGCTFGLAFGLALGWSRLVSNWTLTWVKLIGPIPATAWIPLSIVLFPSSFTAGIFLIALASWFPVMALTWSGVGSVPRALLEAAQTLGADEKRLLRHVVIPAALPNVFVGLFMSLGTAFATLVVAEMLGVKAGLGWYLTWAQGWSEYHKVYTVMLLLGALFTVLVSIIFTVRKRVLGWQKGILRW